MKPASEMRPGMVVRLDDELYRVIHAEYHSGGGQMHGAVHAKLRNVRTGGATERRFRHDERFEDVDLGRQTMEFLYRDAETCGFMHPDTYEQMELPVEALGPFLPFLQPNDSVQVAMFEGSPVEVITPESAEVRVETTAEPLHIQNASFLKEATLEGGIEVHVPQFIKSGDAIRIEVESHKYLARVRH